MAQLPALPRAELRAVRVAASEQRLWIARVQGSRTLLQYRGASEPPTTAPVFNGPVAALTAAGLEAYAFLDDGSFYRFADGWTRAVDLPQRAQPLHLTAVEEALYGLVAAGVARQLPLAETDEAAATTSPFDPGAAALALVRYDARGWSGVTPCPVVVPPEAPAGLGPRLCPADGRLLFLWKAPALEQIAQVAFDLRTRRWTTGATLGVPHVRAFWVCVVNRVPTLVAAVTRPDGSEELVAYRLIGASAPGAVEAWQPAPLELSTLPAAVGPARVVDAFGFNQHLGVLVTTAAGQAHVRFGRVGAPPVMATLDVYASEKPELPTDAAFQTLRAAVLLGILAALLAFRRGSIATSLRLPRGWVLAFTMQRLAGCVIDLAPFVAVVGLALGIDWSDGLTQVVRWAFEPQMTTGSVPDLKVLLWCGGSAGGYSLYCLILELVTGRTVGKMINRVELLAESGAPPAAWQIVTRNVCRFIEILPPFWILGFLVLISRNRQRAGDIFARTVAVRRVAPAKEEEPRAPGP